jgi:carbamate kinase
LSFALEAGGIPVALTSDGAFRGVEAVIDKDLAAALLAEQIEADALLLPTDVSAVWSKWPPPNGEPIGHVTVGTLRQLTFAAGSMGPKVGAACRFAERTRRIAAIGAIEQAEAMLGGRAATTAHPES